MMGLVIDGMGHFVIETTAGRMTLSLASELTTKLAE